VRRADLALHAHCGTRTILSTSRSPLTAPVLQILRLSLDILPKLPPIPATTVLLLMMFSCLLLSREFRLHSPSCTSKLAYHQARQIISVAIQSAHAHFISITRDLLALDVLPTHSDTAGPLPRVPPLLCLRASWSHHAFMH